MICDNDDDDNDDDGCSFHLKSCISNRSESESLSVFGVETLSNHLSMDNII